MRSQSLFEKFLKRMRVVGSLRWSMRLMVPIRLYGYPDNVWTDAAVEALRAAGIVEFEMKPAPEGVNWDNPSPVFRKMPTLTLVRPHKKEFLLASGIDEVRELMENVEKDSDDDLHAFLLKHGLKEEDIDALRDVHDLGGDQEEQSEA